MFRRRLEFCVERKVHNTHGLCSVKWLDDGLCKQLPRESPSFISFLTKKPFLHITYRWKVQYRMYTFTFCPQKPMWDINQKQPNRWPKFSFAAELLQHFFSGLPHLSAHTRTIFRYFMKCILLKLWKKNQLFLRKYGD